MLGGYQILDLREIDLTNGSSASDITNSYVLGQLRNMRDYIQKDYNFARPLNNQLKPVLIRYRDKKSGEKHERAIFGALAVLTNYYTYQIIANANGETLSIDVVFEEKTDEYSNKYWDIKTAKILLTKEVKIFENIIDKDGHKRFIEGEGESFTLTGYTNSYCKWSLSGTHLLLVVAGTFENAVTIPNNSILGSFEVPKWIADKIVPVWAGEYLEKHTVMLVNDDWSVEDLPVSVRKTSSDILKIETQGGSVTTTKARAFRIQVDLLIDNE